MYQNTAEGNEELGLLLNHSAIYCLLTFWELDTWMFTLFNSVYSRTPHIRPYRARAEVGQQKKSDNQRNNKTPFKNSKKSC